MAAVFALIENEGKILLVQRSSRSTRPGQWCLPGGGVKRDETLEQACVREVKEETGLNVNVISLLATIKDNSYFTMHLLTNDKLVGIPNNEIQNGKWCKPKEILDVGEIMDLGRMIPLLRLARLSYPDTPEGLKLAEFND